MFFSGGLGAWAPLGYAAVARVRGVYANYVNLGANVSS